MLRRQQLDRFKKATQTQHLSSSSSSLLYYEPNYPKWTRLHDFPTRASEKEMAKHDRYIVHSLLYTEMLTEEYLHRHWKVPDNRNRVGPWKFDKKVCIAVRIKPQREIPYINALIMTLMGAHVEGESSSNSLNKKVPVGHRLLSYVDLNLVNAVDDGTVDEHDHNGKGKILNLNFVKVHNIGDGNRYAGNKSRNHYSKRLENIVQMLQSARICVESNLPWCLLMEEYTVVSIDFLNSLKRYVIAPLESFAASHRMDETESDGEVFSRMKKMSVISLFSAYNSETASVMRVHDVEYSKNQYEKDRGKINSELKAMDLDEYDFQYAMYPIVEEPSNSSSGKNVHSVQGGLDTAMLFHTSMVESDLIPMLRRMKRKEERRIAMEQIKGFFGFGNLQGKEQDGGATRFLDVERELSLFTGIKRYRVEPSLVNRIGFYDEDFQWDNANGKDMKSNLGITNWLTDPRFVFEPGDYYEGIDEYCELDNGTWIWDALHNHRVKSCCDEKYATHKRCLGEE